MRGVVAPLLWGATRVRPRFVCPLGMPLVLSVVPGASRPAYCLPWAARHGLGGEVPLDGGTAPQGYLKAGLRPFRAAGCAVPGPGLMRSGAAVARSPDQRYRVLCERAGRATTPARAGHERPQLAMEPRVFVPPCRDGIPPAPFGDAVVCGRAIFDHAGRYARSFVGGALSGATVIRERTEGAPGRCGRRSPSSRDPGGPVTTLAARIPVPFGQRENGRLPP